MKKTLLLLIFLCCNFLSAQTVSIPDPEFEQVLIDAGIDSDGIINGQILSTDAEFVTSLTVDGFYTNAEDLTGLEAFINLEELTVMDTGVQELNLTQNTQLRILNLQNNWLSSIDVSANTLLEVLDISNDGEMGANQMSIVDLSNNPDIHTFYFSGVPIDEVSLNNGNNNTNMTISFGITPMGPPPEEPYGNVCFIVDNTVAAQNNQHPYSDWEINNSNYDYHFVDDCTMSSNGADALAYNVYPNPVVNILNIEKGVFEIEKVLMYDNLGRKVLETGGTNSISVAHLANGSYILRIVSGKSVLTKKILVTK